MTFTRATSERQLRHGAKVLATIGLTRITDAVLYRQGDWWYILHNDVRASGESPLGRPAAFRYSWAFTTPEIDVNFEKYLRDSWGIVDLRIGVAACPKRGARQ
jgi:hypothetical protein